MCVRGRSDVFLTESGDLLAVLDELHTHTLANGRVGLLGLNTDLLEDDTLGVGRALWQMLASMSSNPFACPSSPMPSNDSSNLLSRCGGRFQEVSTYTEGRGLEGGAQQSLLVVEVGPSALTAGVAELARGQKTSRLSFTHVCCTVPSVLVSLGSFGGWWRGIVRNLGGVARAGGIFGFVREFAGVRIALVKVMRVDSPVLRCVDGSS